MIALALAAAVTAHPGLTEPFFGLPRGRFVKDLPCSIFVDGRKLFAGRCNANTHGAEPWSLSVQQDDSGCNLDFYGKGAVREVALSGYRQQCLYQGSKDEADDLREPVARAGSCWAGKHVRVCLTPRRGALL